MGMFDYVKYECECPACGDTVSDFQSKDGRCLLEHVAPSQVDHFYSSCDGCGVWISFQRIPSVNFEMKVTKREDGERTELTDYTLTATFIGV